MVADLKVSGSGLGQLTRSSVSQNGLEFKVGLGSRVLGC